MRVFVTGASGFIGSAIVRELVGAGHRVLGLARSASAERSVVANGGEPVRGHIQDLATLRRAAERADGAIHLAFFHALGQMDLATRLRVFLGGAPGGIVGRFLEAAVTADRRAIEAIGESLGGPDRPLVAAFGTLGLAPGRLATEDAPHDPGSVGGPRAATEDLLRELAGRGVRACAVRLPPMVHGEGDRAGLAPRLIAIARKARASAYLGDGRNRWPAVHRLDAARLFRLALERGSAGARYHSVAEQGVPLRAVADLIGRRLGVPVVAAPPERAPRQFGWLSAFLPVDNPVSSEQTRDRLGWSPTHPGLLDDLENAGYF